MQTNAKNKMQKAKKTKKKVATERDLHVCVKCGFQKITLAKDGSFCCPRCGHKNRR